MGEIYEKSFLLHFLVWSGALFFLLLLFAYWLTDGEGTGALLDTNVSCKGVWGQL